jgi:pimeloyl-ACP methyl ester carboxylesterase
VLYGAYLRGAAKRPGGDHEARAALLTAENAVRLLEGLSVVDVREEASRLTVPTLVLPATGDARIPFEEGRLIASTIQSASFVPLDSENHILLPREQAFSQALAGANDFLREEPGPRVRQPPDGSSAPSRGAQHLARLRADHAPLAAQASLESRV